MKIIKLRIKYGFYILIKRGNKIGIIFIQLSGKLEKFLYVFFITYFCNIHMLLKKIKILTAHE